MDSGHSGMLCGSSETGMLLTKPYGNQFHLIFSFVWIFQMLLKLFKAGRQNGFLGASGWITFGGHLSKRTIYDLKGQFSDLAPWNMHW